LSRSSEEPGPQRAEVSEAELMAQYGIARVPADHYHYKDYRYSRLSDAIAQAKRDTPRS
jgi:hypothetical protein